MRFKKIIFLTFLLATKLFLFGCTSKEKIAETTTSVNIDGQAYDQVDQSLIQEVAAISAKVDWCGMDYKPFYLSFMQFERVPNKLSQMQLAFIGYSHGANLTQNLKGLKDKKCSKEDVDKLSLDYHQKLADWYQFADQRKELALHCEKAAQVVAR